MKNYTVTRLDKRYGGHTAFKYAISPISKEFIQRQQDFRSVRNWAWDTYGPSAERDWVLSQSHIDNTQPTWAWDTEHGNTRLYLKSDAELTLFELKFS